jgi:hypothetical protein
MLSDAWFGRFWATHVIAEAGPGVGAIALPLTAVLTLSASAVDMGLLAGASTLPALLFGLHAGVRVDRLPMRPILVVTNVAQGALLAAVPAAAVPVGCGSKCCGYHVRDRKDRLPLRVFARQPQNLMALTTAAGHHAW